MSYASVVRQSIPWEYKRQGVVPLLDMLWYAADVFCVMADVIGRIIGQPVMALGSALDNISYRQELVARFRTAYELCIKHEWIETAHRILEVEEYLANPNVLAAVLQSKCADLETHVLRVLSDELFFHADSKRATEIIGWTESSKAWEDHFPLAHEELSRALDCYLFNQPTASVFHCMRGLEISLAAFAHHLHVATGRNQWEVIINNIESHIKRINGPHAGSDWKEKQETYSEAALHFRYLKSAWRNHAMHARESYDLSKASAIWHHTSDFIAELRRMGLKES